MASLQARELNQPLLAVKTLHRALGEDPRDRAAHASQRDANDAPSAVAARSATDRPEPSVEN